MAGVDLTQAQAMLAAYIAAELAVLKNQAYEIAGRRLTRANLKEITDGRRYWEGQVALAARSASGRSRGRTIVIRG